MRLRTFAVTCVFAVAMGGLLWNAGPSYGQDGDAEARIPEPSDFGFAHWEDDEAPTDLLGDIHVADDETYITVSHGKGGGSCDQGCGSVCGCGLFSRLRNGISWTSFEYMSVWTSGNDLPPLVTTSTAGTAQVDAGRIGLPSTSVLYGGQSIGDEQRNGFRFGFGKWLDCCHCSAIDVVYMAAFEGEDGDDFTASSANTPILALPYFDANLNSEEAFLSAYPGIVGGDIMINTSSEMHSASVLYRRLRFENGCSRIDLLGGYRFFRYREALQLNQDITTLAAVGPFGANTRVETSDRFLAENDFHGGEFGISAQAWEANMTVEVLAKVAIGSLRRASTVSGQSTVTAGGAVQNNGGIYTQDSNIATYTNDEFAVLPELGVNLNLFLNDRVSASIGYTGLYLNDVFRTGDLIDRTLDTNQFFGGPAGTRPRVVTDQDDDFWAHALTVGVVIEN